MKLYLDTSTNLCTMRLNEHEYQHDFGHKMTEEILQFIHEKLLENDSDWQDISEIHYFAGPGSFTGLRIGAAIVNVLADQLHISLYDQDGNERQIILPDYGRPANISTPRK